MRQLRYAIVLLAALLAACTQLGLQAPQTFSQKLAYGYSTLASVRTTAAHALDAKQITVADAKQVLDLSDQARALLDAAGMAQGTGDLSTAASKLALATTILTQLQTYLAAHQKGA